MTGFISIQSNVTNDHRPARNPRNRGHSAAVVRQLSLREIHTETMKPKPHTIDKQPWPKNRKRKHGQDYNRLTDKQRRALGVMAK